MEPGSAAAGDAALRGAGGPPLARARTAPRVRAPGGSAVRPVRARVRSVYLPGRLAAPVPAHRRRSPGIPAGEPVRLCRGRGGAAAAARGAGAARPGAGAEPGDPDEPAAGGRHSPPGFRPRQPLGAGAGGGGRLLQHLPTARRRGGPRGQRRRRRREGNPGRDVYDRGDHSARSPRGPLGDASAGARGREPAPVSPDPRPPDVRNSDLRHAGCRHRGVRLCQRRPGAAAVPDRRWASELPAGGRRSARLSQRTPIPG